MPLPGDQRGPPLPADRPASHTPKRLPVLDRSAGNLVSGKGPFPQNREDAMPDLASVLEQARVPEHSAPFMQAMSQGTAFLEEMCIRDSPCRTLITAWGIAVSFAHPRGGMKKPRYEPVRF